MSLFSNNKRMSYDNYEKQKDDDMFTEKDLFTVTHTPIVMHSCFTLESNGEMRPYDTFDFNELDDAFNIIDVDRRKINSSLFDSSFYRGFSDFNKIKSKDVQNDYKDSANSIVEELVINSNVIKANNDEKNILIKLINQLMLNK